MKFGQALGKEFGSDTEIEILSQPAVALPIPL